MEPGARGAERPLPIQTEPAAFPHAQPGWQKHTLPTTPPPPPRDAAAPAQPQITGALRMLSSSAAGRRTWWGGKAKHNGVYMPLGQSTGVTGWPLIPVVAMGNAAHKPMAVLGSAGPGTWRKINPTAQGKKMSPPGYLISQSHFSYSWTKLRRGTAGKAVQWGPALVLHWGMRKDTVKGKWAPLGLA